MQRSHRRLYILLGLLGLAIVLPLGVRFYLHSSAAARQVAGHLSSMIGAPIEIGGLDVGLGASSAENVRLFESDAKPGDKPWATAKRIDVDVALGAVVSGSARPRDVTLYDADVNLRFDAAGQLLTRLPQPAGGQGEGPLPVVRIENARLALDQAGHPELVLTGVSGTVRPDGEGVTVEGTVADPTWGNWKANGSFHLATKAGSATLQTTRPVHVTPDLLARIPFVPPETWNEVRLTGDTTAAVTVRIDPAARPELHYQVSAEPRDTAVFVQSIDTRFEHAAGAVVVEDGVIRLRGVRGQTAGGEVTTDGELDFRSQPSHLAFRVGAKRLDVAKLPAKWGLNKTEIEGKLTGSADLRLAVGSQGIHTQGSGKAEVDEATLAGFPTTEPIELRLQAEGDGFRFSSKKMAAAPRRSATYVIRHPSPSALLLPPSSQPPLPPITGGEGRKGEAGLDGGKAAAPNWLLATVTLLLQAPTAAPAANAEPTYLDVNLGLKDVDLAELLKRLKVATPIKLAGKLTFQVQASIPVDTARDLKAYRVNGTASLPNLTVEDLHLENVKAKIVYRDGVLQLEEVSARVPPPTVGGRPADPKETGSFQGTAQLGVEPTGDLSAKLMLDKLPVGQLMGLVPNLAAGATGSVSGRAELMAPAGNLRAIEKWKANAHLESAQAKALGWRFADVKADADLDKGLLKLTKLGATIEGARLGGKADLRLNDPYTFDANLSLADADLTALRRLNQPLRPAKPPVGKFDGKAIAKGTLRPLAADIDVDMPHVQIQGIPADKLTGKATYKAGALAYHFKGEVLGGTFDLEGKLPSTAPAVPAAPAKDAPAPAAKPTAFNLPGEGKVKLQNVRLSRLVSALGGPEGWRGRINLDFAYEPTGPGGTAVGSGSVSASTIFFDQTEVASDLQAGLSLKGGRLALTGLSGNLADGRLRGSGHFDLDRLDRGGRLRLTLERVSAVRLAALVSASSASVEGEVDASIDTTLGRTLEGEGTFTFGRLRVGGVALADVHLPVRWEYAPADGVGTFTVRDLTARLGQGRLNGEAEYHYGDFGALRGQLRFSRVDVQALGSSAELGRLASVGTATGRFDFGGRNVRSVNDLTGTLVARLGRSRALDLPVLQQVADLLGISRLSTTFESGAVRANLDRGVVRVQRFSLESPLLKVFIEGAITLRGGLDLRVIANTGRVGINPTALRLLGLRVPVTVGPVPVGLILEVTSYLSNRVVEAEVTGTVASPVVRIRPLRLLTDEAVRFFLNRAVPIAP